MPGTLTALHRLDVDPAGHPLHGISYRQDGAHVDHRFVAADPSARRTALHAALLERAVDLGIVRRTARARDVRVEADRVVVDGLSARWLLACDGLHSSIRRAVGLERVARRRPRRFGLRRHHAVAPWTDLVEVHWGPRSEVYVTPVSAELVGIAVLGPRGMDLDAEVAAVPELAARLEGAPAVGQVRGAGPLLQRTSARTRGPVRLVGDASGYVDALTGEGLRVGLAQAAAAVATLDDAQAYERAWRTVTRDYRLLTTGLVACAGSPLRRAVVPFAVRAPTVFGRAVDRLAR
jgi:flavin-dependent dehydrogenase